MALEQEYEVVWLAEFALPSPSGTLRLATQGGVVDETGRAYARGLLTPTIRREMSAPTYGVPAAPQITLEIAAVAAAEPSTPDGPPGANAIIDAFYDVEPRGAVVKIRRLNKRTGSISTRLVGIVQRVSVRGSRVAVEVADSRLDVFEDLYPRLLVDTDNFPDATSESYALGATIPLHLGTHREHSPVRYVSGIDYTYTPLQGMPKIFSMHRYVVGHTMPKTAGGYANIMPTVAALYRGLAVGVALANVGEYLERVNYPMTVVSGLGVTLVSGGDLPTVTTVWQVTAWNGIAETHATASISATPTGITLTARLTWTQVMGAIGYRVRRDGLLVAYVAGGDRTTFDDTGSAYWPFDPDITIPLSTNTQVGGHTLEVVFPQAQRSADDQLAMILADVDATELAWDPDVRALWHFRDSGIRDSKVGFQNYWTRASCLAFWGFFTSGTGLTSLTGNNTLAVSGTLRPSDWVDGPYKPVVQFGGGLPSLYIADANTTGLNRSTLSTRIDFHARADEDSTDVADMIIFSKYATPDGPGIKIAINYGVLTATVSDGTDKVVAVSSTVFDGAWHRGAVVIDRTLNELRVEVDGAVEATADISLVGSVDTPADVYVGQALHGQIDWLCVDSNILPLVVSGAGKANFGLSAIDFNNANQSPLLIRDATNQGLDLGTSAFEVELWFKLSSLPTSGSYYTLYFKGAPGYWCEVQNTGGVVTFRGWVQGGSVSATAINSTNQVSAGTWHYATLVVPASKQAYVTLDTVKSATVNVTGLNVDSTGNAILGAQDTAGTAKFKGAIDEIRITARERTDAERAEAFYLGKRNLIAQARQLLESAAHGPGLTVNDAEWTAAAAVIHALQVSLPYRPGLFSTDMALVEQRALKEHLGELLKLRGVMLRFASDGTLGVLVDTQRSAVAKYGYFDGTWRNVLDRPERSQGAITDAVQQVRVAFRRKRKGAGEVDKFSIKSKVKAVLTVGSTAPRLIECAAVRDGAVAEVVNSYFGERTKLADQIVSFETADESALLVSPGDIVTLDDPLSGRAVQSLEIVALEERGQRFGFECVAWSTSIYAWAFSPPTSAPNSEFDPDYSATLPPAVAGLGITPTVEVQNDGRRVWRMAAAWTRPPQTNVSEIVIEWKPSTSSAWRPGATVRANLTSVVLDDLFDDASSYDFRIYAMNRFKLAGPVGLTGAVTILTTNPDAPENPNTASIPGSWLVGLTAVGTGARSRRWKWTKHPAKNIDYYEWEVYAAASGGSPVTGTNVNSTGTTRSTHLTYNEPGLARTTNRYLQVRAFNKSGLASLYCARVVSVAADAVTGGSGGDLGNNGTVATVDVAANAITVPTAVSGSLTNPTNGVWTQVAASTVTITGGIVVIHGFVKMTFNGMIPSDTFGLRMLRDGVTSPVMLLIDPCVQGLQNAAQNIILTVPFAIIDATAPAGPVSVTYALQVRRVGTSTTFISDARFNIVEHKR